MSRILPMSFPWKIFRVFIEKLSKQKVYFYQRNYEALRDGTGKHSIKHPEVATHIHIIQKALEDPFQVNQDKSEKKHRCYYATFEADPVYHGKFMKVVVGRDFYGRLELITAYARSSIQANELKLWPK